MKNKADKLALTIETKDYSLCMQAAVIFLQAVNKLRLASNKHYHNCTWCPAIIYSSDLF